ncbi:hypothetical protein [Burkholderia anthina]|uniref:hypothetical protein n=1 Tax=Burkholderia anthina TaxID=179879 RepID=UPI0037BF946F
MDIISPADSQTVSNDLINMKYVRQAAETLLGLLKYVVAEPDYAGAGVSWMSEDDFPAKIGTPYGDVVITFDCVRIEEATAGRFRFWRMSKEPDGEVVGTECWNLVFNGDYRVVRLGSEQVALNFGAGTRSEGVIYGIVARMFYELQQGIPSVA